jgi:hypothetical protein
VTTLPERWSKFLLAHPETGMDYQVVAVTLPQSAFNPLAQRNDFRRRDARPLSRSFARCNPRLRRSPNSTRFLLRLSAMISQYFIQNFVRVIACYSKRAQTIATWKP